MITSIKALPVFLCLILMSGCANNPKPTLMDRYWDYFPAKVTKKKGRPLELISTNGYGGGFSRTVRVITSVAENGNYYAVNIIPVDMPHLVVNVQRLLQPKNRNSVIMADNNIITIQLFQNLPFSYRDLTPVCILALDKFILWVHVNSPWKTASEFVAEARTKNITVGGTGSKQDDEILFRLIERAADIKSIKYIAKLGGTAVAESLANNQIAASVNQFREVKDIFPWVVRPLCVFQDKPFLLPGGINIPPCQEVGIPVKYNRFIAVFASPGISDVGRDRLINMFEKVSADPYWHYYCETLGWEPVFMTGDKMIQFLNEAEKQYAGLFADLGWGLYRPEKPKGTPVGSGYGVPNGFRTALSDRPAL